MNTSLVSSSASDRPVAVVGGGLAGLAAALTLARCGHQVVVLEASSSCGGRARTRSVDGFDLNLGPHALYAGGAGWSVLRGLGLRVRSAQPRRLATLAIDGGELRRITSIVTRSARDRVRLARTVLGRAPAPPAGLDAATWIDGLLNDSVARAVVRALVRTATYQPDLEMLSATAAHLQMRAVAGGVRYVHGGWQTLIDAMSAALVANGGEIRTSTPVDAVEHDEHGVRAVVLRDDTVIPATSVVVAVADPPRALRLLAGPAAERLAPLVTSTVPLRLAHLDVALRPAGRRLPNVFSLDGDVFVTVPSDVAAVAPADAMVIHLARYLRPGEDDVDHRPELESVLERVRPGWRDDLVEARYVPRSLVSGDRARLATDGPARRITADGAGIPGLALAGDWVGPTGLLADAALASAVSAAGAVARPGVAAGS